MDDLEWTTNEDKDRCFHPVCHNQAQKYRDFCSFDCAIRYYYFYGGKKPQLTEYKKEKDEQNT